MTIFKEQVNYAILIMGNNTVILQEVTHIAKL